MDYFRRQRARWFPGYSFSWRRPWLSAVLSISLATIILVLIVRPPVVWLADAVPVNATLFLQTNRSSPLPAASLNALVSIFAPTDQQQLAPILIELEQTARHLGLAVVPSATQSDIIVVVDPPSCGWSARLVHTTNCQQYDRLIQTLSQMPFQTRNYDGWFIAATSLSSLEQVTQVQSGITLSLSSQPLVQPRHAAWYAWASPAIIERLIGTTAIGKPLSLLDRGVAIESRGGNHFTVSGLPPLMASTTMQPLSNVVPNTTVLLVQNISLAYLANQSPDRTLLAGSVGNFIHHVSRARPELVSKLDMLLRQPAELLVLRQPDPDATDEIIWVLPRPNHATIQSYTDLIGLWLAERFPKQQSLSLPDRTVAIELVADPTIFSWQPIEVLAGRPFWALTGPTGQSGAVYTLLADRLVVASSAQALITYLTAQDMVISQLVTTCDFDRRNGLLMLNQANTKPIFPVEGPFPLGQYLLVQAGGGVTGCFLPKI